MGPKLAGEAYQRRDWTEDLSRRMILARASGASDRHCHPPLHRRRGVDEALGRAGSKAYAQALATHRQVIREASARHEGVEVDTQGDAFFMAFATAAAGLAAAAELTEALMSGPVRVRVGLHTGTPLLADEGYVGVDVHRGARTAALRPRRAGARVAGDGIAR